VNQDKMTANDFERGWRFLLGDEGAASAPEYDDSCWRPVTLPHDWSIEGVFDPDAPAGGGGGYLPTGVGWYRKTFTLTSGPGLKQFLYFDGVYMNSDVWINGRYLGHRPYGYSAFEHDLTPFLQPNGRKNVIAVRVDNSLQPNSRWYSGSGINRHVQLRTRPYLHIDPFGCSLTTGGIGAAPGDPQTAAWADVDARIRVRVGWYPEPDPVPAWDHAPDGAPSHQCRLTVRIVGADGAVAGESTAAFALTENSDATIASRIRLTRPALWSPDAPSLYRLRCTLSDGDVAVEEQEFTLGVRTAEFDAQQGFLLNGVKTILKGVCLHHDAGCLGSAVPERAWRRRLGLLKEMGCNALRLSHCPFPSEVYDLCDEIGFLVMDEAFDEWNEGYVDGWREGTWGKCANSYHLYFDQWAETDLRTMIRRDRRHPCVVIYSVGNEIPEQGRPDACPKLLRLLQVAREEDPTRAVTMGCDNAWQADRTGLMDLLDVAGYNYVHRKYPDFYRTLHREHPTRRLLGTETHTYYDYWRAVRDNPAVAGEFIWAGIDYLGEAEWPRVMSVPSPIDVCAFPKPHFFYYRAIWSNHPTVHIAVERPGAKPPVEWDLPDVHSHWNWVGGETPLKVVCYSNCDEVELFLNGRSLGASERIPDGSPVHTWAVRYEPGSLMAVGRSGGVAVEHVLQTAGAARRLRLLADTAAVAADGWDVAHVEVCIVDAEGAPVADAEVPVRAVVTGAGMVAAMASADPCGHTPYQSDTHRTYQGRVLVVVRALIGLLGDIRVEVTSPGLEGAELHIACG
jgi:beta-galactosidase